MDKTSSDSRFRSEVKNNKNVSNYYFLTDLGRTIFEKRFESFSGDVHIDKKPVLEMFKLSGWTIGEEIGGVVELSNATSKPISLHFITTYDRNKITGMINDRDYYLCANDSVANIFVQETVKQAAELRRPLSVFIASYDNFEKGGAFERVSF